MVDILTPTQRPTMPTLLKVIRKLLIISTITIVMAFVFFEVGFRFLVDETPEGAVTYSQLRLRPLALPLESIETDIADYLSNETEAIMIYDALTGWTYAPNVEAAISTNSEGMRDNNEYERDPADDVLRIAVFGDSFIAGQELADDETFTVQLVDELAERGIIAEVLNFGVSGFGVDQAYLRWLHMGRDFNPDIVIMGFQSENMVRNMNTFRPFICSCGPSLFKPRFILNDNGELELVGSPTPPPEEIPDILANFDDYPLAEYEWYDDERYAPSLWDISYTWRIIEAFQYTQNSARHVFVPALSPDDERIQLTEAILTQFAAEVRAAEQSFVLLHIPPKQMVAAYLSEDGLPYQGLLDDLETIMPVIHAETIFDTVEASDWMPNAHYSPQAQNRMATLTTEWLIAEFEMR